MRSFSSVLCKAQQGQRHCGGCGWGFGPLPSSSALGCCFQGKPSSARGLLALGAGSGLALITGCGCCWDAHGTQLFPGWFAHQHQTCWAAVPFSCPATATCVSLVASAVSLPLQVTPSKTRGKEGRVALTAPRDTFLHSPHPWGSPGAAALLLEQQLHFSRALFRDAAPGSQDVPGSSPTSARISGAAFPALLPRGEMKVTAVISPSLSSLLQPVGRIWPPQSSPSLLPGCTQPQPPWGPGRSPSACALAAACSRCAAAAVPLQTRGWAWLAP